MLAPWAARAPVEHSDSPRRAVCLVPGPSGVVPFDCNLDPLGAPHCEKEAACAPDVIANPACRSQFRPGRLEDGPQVDARRDLPPFQRLPVAIPDHQPSRLLKRLQGIWAISAAHAWSVASTPA